MLRYPDADVVAAWTKIIVDYAAKRGVEVPTMGADLSRPDGRVAAHVDDLIWDAADVRSAIRTSRPYRRAGHLRRELRRGRLPAPRHSTVGEAIARAGQFHRLIKDRGHCDLRIVRNDAMIIDIPEPDRPLWSRPMAELIMANYVQLTGCGPRSA